MGEPYTVFKIVGVRLFKKKQEVRILFQTKKLNYRMFRQQDKMKLMLDESLKAKHRLINICWLTGKMSSAFLFSHA